MNAFLAKVDAAGKKARHRTELKTLQANMGNLCNQRCRHCHIGAGPDGKNVMKRGTVDDILKFLSRGKGLVLDITGGAPELTPEFNYFVRSARDLVKEIIVRSNLTVLFEPGKEYLPSFFKENGIHLICSLPCYTRENVDKQRGSGVFERSVEALRLLNAQGYGGGDELFLDLVYNPGGAFLPASQEKLEKDYKKKLKEEHGVVFNGLITMTNAPINRFKQLLQAYNEYDEYMELLQNNFNRDVIENIMCRTLLSVGWDGTVYDCDFNQALALAITGAGGKTLNIKYLEPDELAGRKIRFDDHCFSCTAGSGSSCQGVLE